jgi:CheY-like chemotaxis protein
MERPLWVDGDQVRLTQVVTNLLNNAAKYQAEGGRITLVLEREGAEVVIRVRDEGMGIAPEMLSQVFDLFVQAESTLHRAHGGLGIGLSLVKRLAEMHGGNVRAFSGGAGHGSEFVVRLPCRAAGPDAVPTEAAADAELPTGVPMRILVVDDNCDAAESLTALLRHVGHEVFVAHDGLKAIEIASAQRPQVVLLDIGLPGMDGLEVCKRLRQQGMADTRIVALTGYGQDADKRRSEAAGFDAHAVKPVDPAVLMRLLPGGPISESAAVRG